MRVPSRSRKSVLGTALLAAVLAGCSSATPDNAVTSAAVRFVEHLQRHDGGAACAMLTSTTRKSVSGATKLSCSKAIDSVDEHGTAIGGVQIWDDAAQVHVGQDVVFLRRISGTWLVSAASCKPQPTGPYDCKVGG
jgi:hypothetical protein